LLRAAWLITSVGAASGHADPDHDRSDGRPDPADLPPPAPRFLDFLARSAAMPRTTREEFIAVNVELWRVLNGDVLSFDERAAGRLSEETLDGSADSAAALNHDLAGRVMTSDRLVPLSLITAPTLVVHGTEDPLRPLPHGEAVAVQIQHARMEVIPGMGRHFVPVTGPSSPDRRAHPGEYRTARGRNELTRRGEKRWYCPRSTGGRTSTSTGRLTSDHPTPDRTHRS
jgi:pimeloyl-ACP methyl ester carboxylesterase